MTKFLSSRFIAIDRHRSCFWAMNGLGTDKNNSQSSRSSDLQEISLHECHQNHKLLGNHYKGGMKYCIHPPTSGVYILCTAPCCLEDKLKYWQPKLGCLNWVQVISTPTLQPQLLWSGLVPAMLLLKVKIVLQSNRR